LLLTLKGSLQQLLGVLAGVCLDVDDHRICRCSTSSLGLLLDGFVFSGVINFRLEKVITPKRLV